MSYDGNGKPGNGVWSTSHEAEWDAVRRRPGNKTDRLQREPARGWHRNAIAMNLCKVYWTRSGANVLLGWQRPPGRKQTSADRLILMGDWRDSFAAMNEETGAI